MTVRSIHFDVADLDQTRRFYGDILGFGVAEAQGALTCAAPHGASLVFRETPVAPHVATGNSRYWKIGLTLPDLDRAVAHLDRIGWPVSRPRQFLDIGYMCHLTDPSGLPIELLQHGFEGRAAAGPDGHDIGAQATLAHLTLRADTGAAADAEWLGAGMTLLSIQPVPDFGFTLYFYARSDETPPEPDLTAVANREWLWRRLYTLVEVQVYDDGRPILPVDETRAGMRRVEI